MNKLKLIKELQEHPDNLPVFIARDPEGNAFHKVYEVSFYLHDDDEDMNDWTNETFGGPAIVLWP